MKKSTKAGVSIFAAAAMFAAGTASHDSSREALSPPAATAASTPKPWDESPEEKAYVDIFWDPIRFMSIETKVNKVSGRVIDLCRRNTDTCKHTTEDQGHGLTKERYLLSSQALTGLEVELVYYPPDDEYDSPGNTLFLRAQQITNARTGEFKEDEISFLDAAPNVIQSSGYPSGYDAKTATLSGIQYMSVYNERPYGASATYWDASMADEMLNDSMAKITDAVTQFEASSTAA